MIRLLWFVLLGSELAIFNAAAQSSPTFVPTGKMTIARGGHTATLLKNGRVLITGGTYASLTAELYDPSTETFTATGNMTTTRVAHTATLLLDGRVLVSGEYTGSGTSELYDPATGLFTQTGGNTDIHSSQVSNLLSNGKVLISGPPSVEIYDPASASDTRLGLIEDGTGAVVLKDDKLVIVGGGAVSLYDVTGDSLKLLDSLATTAIYDQTATLLTNGSVLLAGGHVGGPGEAATDETALYDPRGGTVVATGRLQLARRSHTATMLPGGRVLVYGGYRVGSDSKEVILAGAEEYDSATGGFTYAGSSTWSHGSHTATLLRDGTVLIAGGASDTSAELYIPPLRAGSAASLTGPLAPESLASLFGSRMAFTAESADPLSPSARLGGISLRIIDSAGTARFAPLLHVSPSQINFEVPQGTAPGDVTVELLNNPTTISQVAAKIREVAPGLFAFANNTAAAYALRIEPNGAQTVLSAKTAIVLDDHPIYLVLYATGIRNRSSLANVQATIGGIDVPVEYAGPEGSGVPGLDQVNLHLQSNLKGIGVGNLVLTVDGVSSNTVSVDIR